MQVVSVPVTCGQKVNAGEVLFEVETAKAVVQVESERKGFVTAILCAKGQEVACGSVLGWLGETPEDVPPTARHHSSANASKTAEPPLTLRARELLRQHSLDAEAIPRTGARLTAADIERHLQGRHGVAPIPSVPVTGENPHWVEEPLSQIMRGMMQQVQWHRDNPVGAYCEVTYDPHPWDAYARQFAGRERLLLSPLLALMAHRLSRLATDFPHINAFTDGRSLFRHLSVHLGFTVSTQRGLYLVVVRNSETLTESEFVASLTALQRAALRNRLQTGQTRGATVTFSSLAGARVSRHVPILPPQTSLIVAHTIAAQPGTGSGPESHGVLGATYDHRILDGLTVSRVLQSLCTPPPSAAGTDAQTGHAEKGEAEEGLA
jgi:pyruvate/2-oxoglutarate dehydrogenase complex dihydrolipoamide acyltransferase (E2) component